MQGRSILIPFSTYIISSQVTTNLEVSISIQRSFSNLKGVLITLYKKTKAVRPGSTQGESVWNPMGEVAKQTPDNLDWAKTLHLQLKIDRKLYPEYPTASLEEAYYQQRKMIHKGIGERTIDVNYGTCRNECFIVGFGNGEDG